MGTLFLLNGDIRPASRLHGKININNKAHRWDAVGGAENEIFLFCQCCAARKTFKRWYLITTEQRKQIALALGKCGIMRLKRVILMDNNV